MATYVRDDTGELVNRTLNLPGGALVDIDADDNQTWSYTGVLGRVILTGTGSEPFVRYDPYGQPIDHVAREVGTTDADTVPTASGLPETRTGWHGAALKLYEPDGGVPTIQMGARVYVPALGRFLQTGVRAFALAFSEPFTKWFQAGIPLPFTFSRQISKATGFNRGTVLYFGSSAIALGSFIAFMGGSKYLAVWPLTSIPVVAGVIGLVLWAGGVLIVFRAGRLQRDDEGRVVAGPLNGARRSLSAALSIIAMTVGGGLMGAAFPGIFS